MGKDDGYDYDDPREAARRGDAEMLREWGESDPEALHEPDELGWHPLHEAVRAGHVEAVRVILGFGGNINLQTYTGVSPLNIALEHLGEDHEMTKFLEENGAVDLYPEL